MEHLITYNWPGNVRELRNAVEYAFVLCNSGGIAVGHLPPKIVGAPAAQECAPRAAAPPPEPAEKQELIRVLRETGGNRSEAARRLGVSRVTVWKRMKKFGIDSPRAAGGGSEKP